MDLAVVAIDGGGGGGVCCDCGCDYGGSGGRLWVVVEVASFDCGCVVVGYICGWVVVIGYICGCGWKEKESGRKEREEYFLLFY